MKLKGRLAAALLIVALVGLYASSDQALQVAFTFSPPQPTVNDVVTFDGSGSSNPGGRIVKYEWDFDGDGTYDLASNSPQAEWLYDEGGNYQVSLRITGDGGAVATGAMEIEVEDAPVAIRQTISPQRALPGDRIEVTVEINFHTTVNGPGLQVEPPRGWRLREVDSNGAVFKQEGSQYQWLWVQGLLSGDRLRITYKVQVPEDAPRGLYKIGGLVSSFSPRFVIPIPKDVEVQVM